MINQFPYTDYRLSYMPLKSRENHQKNCHKITDFYFFLNLKKTEIIFRMLVNLLWSVTWIQPAIYEYCFLTYLYYLESGHAIFRKTAAKSSIFIFLKIWKDGHHLRDVCYPAVKYQKNPSSHLWDLTWNGRTHGRTWAVLRFPIWVSRPSGE